MIIKMNKSYQNKNSGFTLLEMIVSMGIFTIVAVIAVGSLVRITSLNRQAQSMQAAINNINYILESISREMRVGSEYYCVDASSYNGGENLGNKECNAGSKGVLFKSSKIKAKSGGGECNLIYGYWFTNNNNLWNISKSQQAECGDSLNRDGSLPLVDLGNVTITNVVYNTLN